MAEELASSQGILVAPGFGHRGFKGKLAAIKYAREENIPFLGISLGMQCAVVEFARNVLDMPKANSKEMDHTTPYPVIDLMEEHKSISDKGGSMRIGSYKCKISKNSKAYDAYQTESIKERHRHRFEFNNEYLPMFEKAGMVATGINPETGLVEIIENVNHKWFVGVQFHPEYQSTVLKPHPLFKAFVKKAIEEVNEKK